MYFEASLPWFICMFILDESTTLSSPHMWRCQSDNSVLHQLPTCFTCWLHSTINSLRVEAFALNPRTQDSKGLWVHASCDMFNIFCN